MSNNKGALAEQTACDFLLKNGLQLIARNYNCKMGEIDLIFRDSQHVVFVEVRSRSSTRYGSALESITYSKQRRIIRAAQLFLLEKKWTERYPCRFDVITLQLEQAQPHIEWIKDAFSN